MNGFEQIKEQLYTVLGSIATVDGYNFNWTTKKRLDTFIKEAPTVTATVHYPEDAPLGEGEIRELSTNEYRVMSRIVEIKSKVKSTTTVINQEEIKDQNNEVIDGMIWDLHKAINVSSLNSPCLGIIDVFLGTPVKESITSKGVYYPFLLNMEIEIIYKEER